MTLEKIVPAAYAEVQKLDRELHRLQNLAQLREGWDGADARPLSSLSVAHAALASYSVLNTYGIAPSFIAPVPDGGIQVEWESGDSALELTIGPDGYKEILLVLDQRSGQREVHEYGESMDTSEHFDRAARMYFQLV